MAVVIQSKALEQSFAQTCVSSIQIPFVYVVKLSKCEAFKTTGKNKIDNVKIIFFILENVRDLFDSINNQLESQTNNGHHQDFR